MKLSYKDYHKQSMELGDVDPSYGMLKYVCDRFELNMEQRYWLAFLYATCYCGATVFYIYNEFPDFENVDEERLEKWWAENRSKLYFQTDRRWVRSRNQWCDVFRSYKKKIGSGTQEEFFKQFETEDPYLNYDKLWTEMSGLYQFGRFAMFLYLEAVHVVTGFNMKPKTMDLADAESCRNGLAYAIGRPDLLTDDDKKLSTADMKFLQDEFDKLVPEFEALSEENNVWNIETTLCAYKKYQNNKRWIGYYLERQSDEIIKMQTAVRDGVEWEVLWDFRKETLNLNHF